MLRIVGFDIRFYKNDQTVRNHHIKDEIVMRVALYHTEIVDN